MRVFVIWDHTSPAVRTLLEALPELCPTHDDQPITWHIPSATALGQKIARDVMTRGIAESEHVIALLDRPSASVGWLVGLAVGFQRSLQLAFLGAELPTWTQVGVLKGLFAHHLSDVAGVRQLLAPQPWEMPAIPPSAEPANRQLILCPSGPIGSTLREVARLDAAAQVLPEDGWGLYELPALLSGCGRVIWVLASDVREGADNAASGVVAGFAEASGLPVSVLRADDVPPVAEVQQRELRFRGLTEFKQKLQLVISGAGIPGSGRAPAISPATAGRPSTIAAPAAAALRESASAAAPTRGRYGIAAAAAALALLAAGVGWRLSWRSAPAAAGDKMAAPVQTAAAPPKPESTPDLGAAMATGTVRHPGASAHGGASRRHSKRQPDDPTLQLFTEFTRIPGEILKDPRLTDPQLQPLDPTPALWPQPTPARPPKPQRPPEPADPAEEPIEPPAPQRAVPSAAPIGQAMSSGEFSALVKRVSRETWSDTRLGIIKDAVSDGKWFTCAQIAQMMKVPISSELRIQIGAAMYPHAVDPGNSSTLMAALSHESDRQQLRKLIRP